MATARRRLTLRGPALALAALLAAGASQANAVQAAGAAPDTGPVGTWRTFSDETGRETGRVQIFQDGGQLYGRVTGIADPALRSAHCGRCTDDRRDQPVLGLQIIRGLKPDGAVWDGGTILDPKTGSVYRCRLRLEDGGRRLVVRGFIGVSLLGRSQTWVRAQASAMAM